MSEATGAGAHGTPPRADAAHRGPGSEGRRALIATALGIALGALVALFSRREERP